jgi:hypothetical protein
MMSGRPQKETAESRLSFSNQENEQDNAVARRVFF